MMHTYGLSCHVRAGIFNGAKLPHIFGTVLHLLVGTGLLMTSVPRCVGLRGAWA